MVNLPSGCNNFCKITHYIYRANGLKAYTSHWHKMDKEAFAYSNFLAEWQTLQVYLNQPKGRERNDYLYGKIKKNNFFIIDTRTRDKLLRLQIADGQQK